MSEPPVAWGEKGVYGGARLGQVRVLALSHRAPLARTTPQPHSGPQGHSHGEGASDRLKDKTQVQAGPRCCAGPRRSPVLAPWMRGPLLFTSLCFLHPHGPPKTLPGWLLLLQGSDAEGGGVTHPAGPPPTLCRHVPAPGRRPTMQLCAAPGLEHTPRVWGSPGGQWCQPWRAEMPGWGGVCALPSPPGPWARHSPGNTWAGLGPLGRGQPIAEAWLSVPPLEGPAGHPGTTSLPPTQPAAGVPNTAP